MLLDKNLSVSNSDTVASPN